MSFNTFLETIIFALIISAFSISSYAQTDSAYVKDTVVISRDEAPMGAPPIMAEKWNQIKTKFFTLNIGFALILDYNIVPQDYNNIQQVDTIDPEVEFRGERAILSGELLFFKRPWRYMISANYNGLDAAQDGKLFSFIDWNFEIPFGKKDGWLTVGKQKEGVGYEYVLPGTQAPFMERGSGAPILVRQRNIGIRYSNSILEQRMTYTLGLFNNWWETGKSFSDNGSQFTSRVTGLPKYTSDRDLIHVGAGYRYTGATEGKLSYKGKPEANTAPSFINTGSFDAIGANTVMLELIGVKGPVSFVSELMTVFVNSTSAGNPSFSYWQIGGSWFITGDNRRYNKKTGNLGKLIPLKNFTPFKEGGGAGAFEVGLRYTQSDFTDKNIDGGIFGRVTGALSWYPDAHFRFEINYGLGRLDKKNLIGKADFWQFRAQYEL
jgi:phosphate-selective porin